MWLLSFNILPSFPVFHILLIDMKSSTYNQPTNQTSPHVNRKTIFKQAYLVVVVVTFTRSFN